MPPKCVYKPLHILSKAIIDFKYTEGGISTGKLLDLLNELMATRHN